MTEKICKWCGCSGKGWHANKRHCSDACREAYKKDRKKKRNEDRWVAKLGPLERRVCPTCKSAFHAGDLRQIYCERGGSCAQAAFHKSDAWQAYIARLDVQERMKENSRRYASTEKGKATQRERDARPRNVARRQAYQQSNHGKSVSAANQRRRNADRALGNLIIEKAMHNV